MDRQSRKQRMDLFAARCREGRVPLTAQRRQVLEALLDLDNHPTADQVHELVVQRMPEVNRTTVYRTLETLVGMGVIHKASHPGRVVRFDPRTERHHHLVCLRCDRVIDVWDENLEKLKIPDLSSTGFQVEDFQVQLRGVCRECRETEDKS
jgi:Fur family peroxide stress response transcriptional regulator